MTDKNTHTPGPWIAGTLTQNDGGIAILTATRDRIAKAWAGPDKGTAAANAALIAVAPQMHAVVYGTHERVSLAGFLRRLLPHIDHEDWRQETVKFIAMLDALSPSVSPEEPAKSRMKGLEKWRCENGDCRDHYGDPLSWCSACREATDE